MHWRLTLDPPYSLATEPGVIITRHCSDFAPNAGVGITPPSAVPYRCPVTNIVMMQPSVFNNNWRYEIQALNTFRHAAADWADAKRTVDNLNMLTTTRKHGFPLIELVVGVGLTGIVNYIHFEAGYDDLKFVLASNWQLKTDESFAVHYHSLEDELLRKNHWFFVQWGNIGIHLSPTGLLRAYKYTNGSLLTDPVQIYEGQLDDPGKFHGQPGFIYFLPIPFVGLVVLHGKTPTSFYGMQSSVSPFWSRGTLIPLDNIDSPDGIGHLTPASTLNLAVNPWHQYLFGFQRVTFGPALSCVFLDGMIEPVYQPSTTGVLTPIVLNTMEQQNSGVLLNSGISGDWQYRPQITLRTADPTYTTFLFGYEASWPPAFTNRATTPVVVYGESFDAAGHKITMLEYSETDTSNFEGKATIFGTASSAALPIAIRGDAVFLLENSPDGTSYSTVFGGIAKHWEIEWIDGMAGEAFHADFVLCDMREFMREQHIIKAGILDGKTLTQAMNALLQTTGQPVLSSHPPQMDNARIPFPKGNTGWRYEFRKGDNASDCADIILFFLRTQGTEYRLRWDWNAVKWIAELKPHDPLTANVWKLGNLRTVRNESLRQWAYESMKLSPEPPEGNIICAAGLTANKNNQYQNLLTTDRLPNYASLSDPTSIDYLGRAIPLVAEFFPSSSLGQLNIFASLLYNATAHHHAYAVIKCPDVPWSLRPGVRLQIIRADGATLLIDGWLKKITIKVVDTVESMVLDVDTVWTGELPKK